MLDPIELLKETIVPVLRSSPELVAALGDDPEAIYSHVYSYPESVEALFQILPQQPTPSLLIAHRSTNLTGPRGNGIEHAYSCYLRPTGNIGPLFVALRDGIPGLVRTAAGLVPGPGSKLKLSQIHYQCHPPLIAALNLQSLLVSDQQFIEYYEAPLIIAERGLDS